MKLVPLTGKGNEHLFRHPKSGIIYFKKFRKGHGQKSKSTRTASPTEARVLRDTYLMELFGQKPLVNRGRKLCGELWPVWVERQKLKGRPATVSSIELSGKHLLPFIGNLSPEQITAEWYETIYVPHKRIQSGLERKFFNDRKWLSMFLIQLKRDGVLEKTPKLIDVDPPRAAGKVYSDSEIKSLLKCASKDLKLQILMAVTMGMRIGEIMALSWDRIDMGDKTIHLRIEDTKTKKARTFGMSECVYRVFKGVMPKAGPLFPSPEDPSQPQGRQGNKRAWATCKRSAGVFGRFHELRHTFLTKAFKCSTNPALICHYAGLSLDEAERTYIHLTADDTRRVAGLVRF